MASIEAFLDLAVADRQPRSNHRLSVHPRTRDRTSRRGVHANVERGLLFAAVVALHIVMLLALRVAMRPRVLLTEATGALQIVFLAPRRAIVVPPVVVPALPRPLRAGGIAVPTKHRRAAPDDARAISRESAPADSGVADPQPRGMLYNLDGALRIPEAPVESTPRDLLAHRRADWMLPGAGRPGAGGFRFRERLTPQRALERVGMLFGGGPFDPCADIARDMVDLDDARARDQAERRYEVSCEGR